METLAFDVDKPQGHTMEKKKEKKNLHYCHCCFSHIASVITEHAYTYKGLILFKSHKKIKIKKKYEIKFTIQQV